MSSVEPVSDPGPTPGSNRDCHPGDALVHVLVDRARALRGLGRPAEALAVLDQAVAADPGVLATSLERTVTLLALDRAVDAVVEAQRGIALDPMDAVTHLVHSRALSASGKGRAAAQAATRCLALAPQYAAGLDALAEALMLQGRRREATAAARQAVALDPCESDRHDTLGRALLSDGRPDEAEAALREALRLDPASSVSRNNLGVVLLKLDRPEEATELFRSAAVDSPLRRLYRDNTLVAARQHVTAPHTALSKAFRVTTMPLVLHVTGLIALVLLPVVLVTRRRRFRQLPTGLQQALREKRRRRARLLMLKPWLLVAEDIAHLAPSMMAAVRARDLGTAALTAMGIVASLLWATLALILAAFLVGLSVQGIWHLVDNLVDS